MGTVVNRTCQTTNLVYNPHTYLLISRFYILVLCKVKTFLFYFKVEQTFKIILNECRKLGLSQALTHLSQMYERTTIFPKCNALTFSFKANYNRFCFKTCIAGRLTKTKCKTQLESLLQ